MSYNYETPYTGITARDETTLESLGMVFSGVTEDGAGNALRVVYDDIKAAILEDQRVQYGNLLINGGMPVAQRGTTFDSTTTPANNDDTYLLDRFILLSDGNDVVDVTQSTDAPVGALYTYAMDVETINKKFGILQIIEQKNAIGIIGGVCSLSFTAGLTGTSLSNIKAVVLSWDGTPDVVTSDVVSAWNADGVTPTWATNWTAENTPVNLSVTTGWAEYTIENISIDTANAANVAVFIWNDDMVTALGDVLYITSVNLVKGAVALPFMPRQIGEEIALCQRYFEKSYNLDVDPGEITTFGAMHEDATRNNASRTLGVQYKVPKRVTPTIIFYSPVTGATGQIDNNGDKAASATNSATNGWRYSGIASGVTTSHAKFHFTAESEL